MALAAWFPYVAAVWLFGAAGYFVYRLRDRSGEFRTLLPIAIYMVGVGLFFVINGYEVFASTSCPAVDCTDLASGLAIVLAASFIARYPLREAWPSASLWVFLGVAWVAVVLEALVAMVRPGMVLTLAYAFAAVIVGVFVLGSLGYRLAVGRSGADDGLHLWSPNVAALALVLVSTLPLVGVAMEAPVLSVLLAPVPLAGAYVFFDRVEFGGDVGGGVEAEATV